MSTDPAAELAAALKADGCKLPASASVIGEAYAAQAHPAISVERAASAEVAKLHARLVDLAIRQRT